MGRIRIREGELAGETDALAITPPLPTPLGDAALRDAFAAALEAASAQGAAIVAAPALGAGALPLQRCAELLFDVARRHLAGPTAIEEIRFVVAGEPAYRVFEAVQDAARIAEQMERLGRRED